MACEEREFRENARIGDQAMIQKNAVGGTDYRPVTVIRTTATQITTSNGQRWMRTTGQLIGGRSIWDSRIVRHTGERAEIRERAEAVRELRRACSEAVNDIEAVAAIAKKMGRIRAEKVREAIERAIGEISAARGE